jgi:hypothetical protein
MKYACKIVVWLIHGMNWFYDEIIECLISDHSFIAAKHDFAVRCRALKQHCQFKCKMGQPEICVLSDSSGMLAGLIPAISLTPLCLLPQHCLACLEGHACSKGCNHCQFSSVERAILRLVSTPSHQGYWQGPVAQCQCLVTSTYMCDTSDFTTLKNQYCSAVCNHDPDSRNQQRVYCLALGAPPREICHSFVAPQIKRRGFPLARSGVWNASLFCSIVADSSCSKCCQLAYWPSLVSFACAGGFEMDQDSSPKLMASLHETHLKRTKNLQAAAAATAAAIAEAVEAVEAACCCCKLEQTSL